MPKFNVVKKLPKKKEFKESSRNPAKKPAAKKISKATSLQRFNKDRQTGIKRRQTKSKPAKMGQMLMSGGATTGYEPLAHITEPHSLEHEKRGIYAGAKPVKFKKRDPINYTLQPPRF